MLEFVCPGCQAVVSLEDNMLGSRVRCQCGHVFQAGRAPESAAGSPPGSTDAFAETTYNSPQAPVKDSIAPGGDPYGNAPQANPRQAAFPAAGAPQPQAHAGHPPLKSKIAAGLLAIFIGQFGVHNFYLGYTNLGIVQVVLTVIGYATSCMGIGVFLVFGVAVWAFVEGIMCLMDSRPDAWGRPLTD
ncbi:MAG: NINE protein [Planctomycetota bacterium]